VRRSPQGHPGGLLIEKMVAVLIFALGYLAGRAGRRRSEAGDPDEGHLEESSPSDGDTGHADDVTQGVDEVRDRERKGSSRTRTRHLLLVLALLGLIGSGAWVLFDSAGATERPASPDGGLLILADAPAGRAERLHVRISTDISDRPDGVSVLVLNIEAPNAPVGTRFYVVASGQSAPTLDIDPIYFCTSPFANAVGNRIRCRDDDILTNWRAVEYRFDDQLGYAVNHDLSEVIDFDGYDSGNAVTITGIFTDNDAESAKVWIPFKTPETPQVSGTTYYSFASLFAGNLGDFGSGRSLGRVDWDESETGGWGFSLASQRTPADFLHVDELAVSAGQLHEGRQVSWSSPPVQQSDSLEWKVDRGIRNIAFSLVDPFWTNQLTIRVFVAGILISTGISLLVLLIERAVFDRGRTQRRS
jgi:hypothetical protein